jgi:hypothetical protein
MKKIPLRKGGTRKTLGEVVAYALVDDADFEELNQYRWGISKDGYAIRTSRQDTYAICPECGWTPKPSVQETANSVAVHRRKKHSVTPPPRRTLLMHRILLGLDPDDPRTGDHLNRIRTDNQRRNLRVLSATENAQNQRGLDIYDGKPCASQYRNVYHVKKNGVWTGKWKAVVAGKYLGCFDSEVAAAEAAKDYRLKVMPFATD